MSTLSTWKFRTTLSAVLLAVASLTPVAHAQYVTRQLRAKIPFAFEYGSHHFAAGVYTVNLISDRLVGISDGKSNRATAIVQPDLDYKPSATGKLVFQRYGDRYFMREVWTSGSQIHVHCFKSNAERQIERETRTASLNQPQGQQVALLEMPR